MNHVHAAGAARSHGDDAIGRGLRDGDQARRACQRLTHAGLIEARANAAQERASVHLFRFLEPHQIVNRDHAGARHATPEQAERKVQHVVFRQLIE